MNNLVVIAFDTPDEAGKVLASLRDQSKRGTISLDDTAVVVKEADGKIHVDNQVSKGTWAGTGLGALVGVLIGTILFPVGGLFLGAAAGAGHCPPHGPRRGRQVRQGCSRINATWHLGALRPGQGRPQRDVGRAAQSPRQGLADHALYRSGREPEEGSGRRLTHAVTGTQDLGRRLCYPEAAPSCFHRLVWGDVAVAANVAKHRELKSIGYELFIGALSVLSIYNLVVVNITHNENAHTVIYLMDAIMTPIFLADFIYRMKTSTDRSEYFWRGFGWADLLSSLPFPNAKILRLFRLWRVIRLFVEFGVRNLVHEFITHRAENALLTVVFLVMCVLEFGSLAVLRAEARSPKRISRMHRMRCGGPTSPSLPLATVTIILRPMQAGSSASS